jgi:hypothetical protein
MTTPADARPALPPQVSGVVREFRQTTLENAARRRQIAKELSEAQTSLESLIAKGRQLVDRGEVPSEEEGVNLRVIRRSKPGAATPGVVIGEHIVAQAITVDDGKTVAQDIFSLFQSVADEGKVKRPHGPISLTMQGDNPLSEAQSPSPEILEAVKATFDYIEDRLPVAAAATQPEATQWVAW